MTHLNPPTHGKRYLEEDFIGYNLESVVKKLQDYWQEGRYVSCEFNRVWLYSDTVTLDEAYVAITGKTKAEFDELRKAEQDEYKRVLDEHKRNIPNLVKEYADKARIILDEEYWEDWDKILEVRLNDLYRGMELGASLDIIEMLNKDYTFEIVKELFEQQGHSGTSGSLVLAIVSHYCKRGAEFKKFV